MDTSFKLLSSMSPMIAPNTKRLLIKRRGPRKLALKKNVRRSSQIDKLPSTLQNNSLVIVNSSIEDIKSPIQPSTKDKTTKAHPRTDFLNELSVTRYAEIKEWITEVNAATNIFDDEYENIPKYVTERQKYSDIVTSNVSSIGSNNYSERNCKNKHKPRKDETCIIITSSSEQSSGVSYKSACSDVVIIESSFQHSEPDYTIHKTNLVQSEPRKKKAVVHVKKPPTTEGKVFPKNEHNKRQPSWLQRLTELCDSDTTASSLQDNILNSNVRESLLEQSVGGQHCNNKEPIKKQIRKKLDFNENEDLLRNKENCNNLLNSDDFTNKKFLKSNHNTEKLIDKANKGKLHKKDIFSDVYFNHWMKEHSHKINKDNLSNTKEKQTFEKNTNGNKIVNDRYEALQETYREKKTSITSSDDNSDTSLFGENKNWQPKVFRKDLYSNFDTDCKSKTINLEKEIHNTEVSKFNNEKQFSDVSSDYESLEDKLRKKNYNIDGIFKGKIDVGKDVDNTATNIPPKEATKKGPPKNLKKPNRKLPTDYNNKVRTSAKSPEDTQKSFLESLSGCVKLSQCNPSARIFRNNFQTYKIQLTTKLFKLYNDKIFDNAIPEDSPIEWSDRMRGTAGYCYCRKIVRSTGVLEKKIRIVLSTKVLDSADRLRDTLIHELCHAATWIVNGVANGHGDHWKAWTFKARQIFPELPPINRCHDYVINTKYTYRCVNCGYSFGRHSKSLDLNTKRCGYCLSKFELLINKKSKDGEVKSVPVTPKREPTGFALFVKENYGIVKTPQLNHGQVMKLLGQKFNELKV